MQDPRCQGVRVILGLRSTQSRLTAAYKVPVNVSCAQASLPVNVPDK
jgi:myo-inositol catabolism protein IolC